VTAEHGRSVLFLLASARVGGNSETLARHAARGLGEGVGQRWLRLSDLPLEPFADRRHDEGDGAYPQPTGHEQTLLEATLTASGIVVVSPLYWYSLSASAKLYLDYWTAWLRVPAVDFKARMGGKALWAVTAHTSDDESYAEPLAGALRRSAEFLAMRWGGILLGSGNRPDEVLEDVAALGDAGAFLGQMALR
jgi:multimeric flavodoxin WrbA